MRLKSQIFKLHDITYKQTRQRAQELMDDFAPDLTLYIKNHHYYSSRPFEKCGIKTLFSSINNSDIVFVADFHTFEQNVKNFRRLIEYFIRQHRPCVVAMEMIMASHQHHLNIFLADEIDELEFLKAINYSKSWRFPWKHYKEIFDLAKANKILMVALNSKGSLQERDIFSADILAKIHLSNPEIAILTLFGELHIVSNNLPQNFLNSVKTKIKSKWPTLKLLPSTPRITIIHQNLDSVYSKLRSENIKNAIVQYQDNEFSIQTSLPWLKYESMLYWFDNFNEDPEFDVHQYIIEKGMKIFGDNINWNFLSICKQLITSLQLEFIDNLDLQNFNIYDHSKIQFVNYQIDNIRNEKLKKFCKNLFSRGHPLKIPYESRYYNSSYSINRLSYLAGLHLFELLCKKDNFSPENQLKDGNINEVFQLLLNSTMIAYFCSKYINPHRKCDLYQDILDKSKNSKIGTRQRQCYQKALYLTDRKKLSSASIAFIFKRRSLQTIYEVTYILGHFWAETLFEKVCELSYQNSVKILKQRLFSRRFSLQDINSLKEMLFNNDRYQQQRKKVF